MPRSQRRAQSAGHGLSQDAVLIEESDGRGRPVSSLRATSFMRRRPARRTYELPSSLPPARRATANNDPAIRGHQDHRRRAPQPEPRRYPYPPAPAERRRDGLAAGGPRGDQRGGEEKSGMGRRRRTRSARRPAADVVVSAPMPAEQSFAMRVARDPEAQCEPRDIAG